MKDETSLWQADGHDVSLGATRAGEGPRILLLPALSSISSRAEMAGLQQALAPGFETLAPDWPGFGEGPRPRLDWQPRHMADWLASLPARFGPFHATVAAGHAAGYALAQAARAPGSLGRLALLSPTWRGPLPTMTGRRLGLFRALARLVDVPVVGAGFYRLNVNRAVIGLMARGHVYADPAWLTPARMAAKRRVTEAPGARHSSFRFVSGGLDPFHDREALLDAARAVTDPVLLLRPRHAPRKSGAEMRVLAGVEGIETVEMPQGKLSFYEEHPEATAEALRPFLTRPPAA